LSLSGNVLFNEINLANPTVTLGSALNAPSATLLTQTPDAGQMLTFSTSASNFAITTAAMTVGIRTTVVVNASVVTISGTVSVLSGRLDMSNGAGTLNFTTLTVNSVGVILISGFTPSNFTLSASTGTILIRGIDWISDSRQSVDVSWRMNPSSPAASVTMTFGGLPPATLLTLTRDAAPVATATVDSAGSATFTVVGGWSLHTMRFTGTPPPPGGGGGGGAPPPPTGTTGDSISIVNVTGFTYYFTVHIVGASATSVTWNFGDGYGDSGVSVYHTYASAGTYRVTAQVVRSDNTSETLTASLVVGAAPDIISWAVGIAAILMLVVAAFTKNERAKFWLTAGSAGLLVFQLSPYWSLATAAPILLGTLVTGVLLLAVGIAALALAFLPTKHTDRIRSVWFILGVLSLVAYYLFVSISL
jgi:hypothetical protein